MNTILTGFDNMISYIEEHLSEKIDYNDLAKIIGYSPYHLQRLFLMLTNIPISEYIRHRRLSCSAYDLLNDKSSVTEIATKYQYSSPSSFQRAFKVFHGISPKEIKSGEHFIKAYPPLRFELSMKGASSLDYKLVTTKAFRVIGKRLSTTMEDGQSYEEIPAFWQSMQQGNDIPKLLPMMNQPPFGLLGLSNYNPDLDESTFDYYIGVASNNVLPDDYVEISIPATTWATFPHLMGTPKEMQEFQRSIVMDWLPSSGYEFAIGPDLEVYGQHNTVETWIPVIKINKDNL